MEFVNIMTWSQALEKFCVKKKKKKKIWTDRLWLFVGWSTPQQRVEYISEEDLLRQFYMLPWDRSSRSNLLSHPVTVYWLEVVDPICYLIQSQYTD